MFIYQSHSYLISPFSIPIILIEKISCIVVAGGTKESSTKGSSSVEVLIGDHGTIQLQDLPKIIRVPSMFPQNGSISLVGGTGNSWKCLQLEHGAWKEQSILNIQRFGHSSVRTKSATYVFGGMASEKTYEYLPKDSNIWRKGKTKIPGKGFVSGCAITVKSEQEIWLIGGWLNYGYLTNIERIISFNVKDHKFKILPYQLNVDRKAHKCAFIPNTNKIMVTGGYNHARQKYLDSTEILDTTDGSVTEASPMNSIRLKHGMGVITINGEDRLVVFGGVDAMGCELDSAEVYNEETEKWEMTDIKLKEPKHSFGFLTFKLSDIVSNFSQIVMSVD